MLAQQLRSTRLQEECGQLARLLAEADLERLTGEAGGC